MLKRKSDADEAAEAHDGKRFVLQAQDPTMLRMRQEMTMVHGQIEDTSAQTKMAVYEIEANNGKIARCHALVAHADSIHGQGVTPPREMAAAIYACFSDGRSLMQRNEALRNRILQVEEHRQRLVARRDALQWAIDAAHAASWRTAGGAFVFGLR